MGLRACKLQGTGVSEQLIRPSKPSMYMLRRHAVLIAREIGQQLKWLLHSKELGSFVVCGSVVCHQGPLAMFQFHTPSGHTTVRLRALAG